MLGRSLAYSVLLVKAAKDPTIPLRTDTQSFQAQVKEARPFSTVLSSSNELGLGIRQKGTPTKIKSEFSSAEPGSIIPEVSRANRKIPIIKRPDY